MDEHERNQIKEHLKWMARFTGDIQTEIACTLAANEQVRGRTNALNKKSDNEIMERLNATIYGFIGIMPLASMNMTNMFMAALSMHSSITKTPEIQEILTEIGEELKQEEEANV